MGPHIDAWNYSPPLIQTHYRVVDVVYAGHAFCLCRTIGPLGLSNTNYGLSRSTQMVILNLIYASFPVPEREIAVLAFP